MLLSNDIILRKSKNILTNLLIALVVLANASYAFSYNYCEMTKKRVCHCNMKNEINSNDRNNSTYISSRNCCANEIININNSSDFENSSKFDFQKSSKIINSLSFTPFIKDNTTKYNLKEVLIFYSYPDDLSLKYSSLLI